MTIRTICAALALGLASAANAGTITIDVAESGGNVVFSGSGSVDLTGASPVAANIALDGTTSASGANGYFGAPLPIFLPVLGDAYNFSAGTFSALTSTAVSFTAIGSAFGYSTATTGADLIVDAGYSSGDSINFTWTAINTTASALGINFGTIASFGTNSIEVTSGTITGGGVGDATVPLPASALLLGSVLSGLLVLRRRKSRS